MQFRKAPEKGMAAVKKGMLGVRIFLENLLLGAGCVGMFHILEMLLRLPFDAGDETALLRKAVSMILTAAAGCWLLIMHRRELGSRIRTGTYWLLTVCPFALLGGVMLYLSARNG